MTSPFLQPAWTIEEAVLLVESSVNIASGVRDAESEVRVLSERLRRGAGLSGLTVSARYRNEDDVRNNLKSMSSILKMIDFVDEEYLQGSTLGAVALYYRKHPDRYAWLLEKAKQLYPDSKESMRVESISDDESTQIDTASEGVSTYPSSRRIRPRISEEKISTVIDRGEFVSVFPYISSKNISRNRYVNPDPKIDSMWVSSSRIKNAEEKTHTDNGRNDIEETGKSDLSLTENRNNTLNNKLSSN